MVDVPHQDAPGFEAIELGDGLHEVDGFPADRCVEETPARGREEKRIGVDVEVMDLRRVGT